MANPFMNNKEYNKEYNKIIINILIFIVFFLPIIISLYLALFNFALNAGQISALFYMFLIGSTVLFITNMPEL